MASVSVERGLRFCRGQAECVIANRVRCLRHPKGPECVIWASNHALGALSMTRTTHSIPEGNTLFPQLSVFGIEPSNLLES